MESVNNIKTVIERCAQGDGASYEALYNHLVDRLYAFVAHRTNNKSEALEVTQDCLVELYKALPGFTYQTDAAFYAFVFTIARRQLAQHYAKLAKHRTTNIEDLPLLAEEPSMELTQAVRSALEKLDECSREIIILHHWSRYTFVEIAAIINLTESAVRVRHHRAKAKLADLLTP